MAVDPSDAKTGFGVRDWTPEDCIAQLRMPGCGVDLGLPDLAPHEARKAGARSNLPAANGTVRKTQAR